MLQPSSRHHPFVRALFGAGLGTVPLLVSMLMSPSHRSPYLLAYPLVILSAWIWGLPAAIASALVSGLLVEYFIFATRQLSLAPNPSGWLFREIIFVAGSIMVGILTRSASKLREKSAIAELNQKLQIAAAETATATARARATKLALENEVRSKLALDGANVGIWEWDVLTSTSKWSDGFYLLHGLEPNGPANYELWRACVHPEDIEQVESSIRKALAEAGTFYEEYRLAALGPEGVRWVACQGVATPNANGEAIKMAGYAGEVTRRKLSDLALLQSEKLAVAGRLSATIAHEIRNPLDAVVNIVYLVQQGVERDEQTELLAEASQQLERISQIARQTLDISRTSKRPAACKPSALVDEALRVLAPKVRLHQTRIDLDLRSESEFACVQTEMQQVLTNVLNNAVEAIGAGGRIRIRISASVDWSNRRVEGIRITIGDTGPGMPPHVRRRIFEPFFTTKESNGTGLGMWVVSELIHKQGGSISISSSVAETHHGTVVSLFMPFAARADKPHDAQAINSL